MEHVINTDNIAKNIEILEEKNFFIDKYEVAEYTLLYEKRTKF